MISLPFLNQLRANFHQHSIDAQFRADFEKAVATRLEKEIDVPQFFEECRPLLNWVNTSAQIREKPELLKPLIARCHVLHALSEEHQSKGLKREATYWALEAIATLNLIQDPA